MGERTDQLGDYDPAGYNPNDPIPPDEPMREAMDPMNETPYTGRPDPETDGLAPGAGVVYSDEDILIARDDTLDPGMAGDMAGMGESDDPSQIRGDIEETRAGMSQTIDEIQERLSPQRLARQARDTVREATIGKAERMMDDARDTARDAGGSFLTTIRENPIPAALAGLGLGWLLYKTWDTMSSSRSHYDDYRGAGGYGGSDGYAGYGVYDARYGDRYVTGYDGMLYSADVDDDMDEGQDDSGPNMADRMQDKAGEMGDRMTGAARQWAGQAQDTAGQWADQAQYQAQRAQGWMQRSWEENPLVVGALALAAGAVIGLSIPETEPENRLMGEARDSFMDKAQETAQKAQAVAQRAASAATDAAQGAAQDEAQKQGLTQNQ